MTVVQSSFDWTNESAEYFYLFFNFKFVVPHPVGNHIAWQQKENIKHAPTTLKVLLVIFIPQGTVLVL
jgi:hypothetical protein